MSPSLIFSDLSIKYSPTPDMVYKDLSDLAPRLICIVSSCITCPLLTILPSRQIIPFLHPAMLVHPPSHVHAVPATVNTLPSLTIYISQFLFTLQIP